jgi:hypothetical protein
MKRSHGQIFLVMFIVFLFGFTGCATLGPVYQKVDKIPEDSGVVNIYRPSGLLGGGVAPSLYTDKGKTYLVKVYPGGYFTYFAKPGEVDFSAATEAESSVTLDIAPGQVYYVKLTIGMGFFVGRPHLIIVPPEVGEKEIEECKLIPKDQ